jgi:5-dehydro-4-deoxyglucarate dehydratase
MAFDGTRAKIAPGLLAFPITDLRADDEIDAASCARRLQWPSSYGAARRRPISTAAIAGRLPR